MAGPDGTYRVRVGSQEFDIPLVEIADDLTIALLISVDLGVGFAQRAGAELAVELAPYEPEIVVSVATMGIPIAIEVTRALGLDDYVILHKTPKIHLPDAIAEPVRSITTASVQRLLFDRARLGAVVGRRVAVVDDVISTGGSTKAALNLLRRVGRRAGRDRHPRDRGGALALVPGRGRRAWCGPLGAIPLFRHGPDGALVEDWEGGGGSTPADAATAPGS